MNALLRSAVLGLALGTAFLLGGSWWLSRSNSTDEPRPFPDEEAARRLTAAEADSHGHPVYLDPHVQVPIGDPVEGHAGRPVGFHAAAQGALSGRAAVGQTLDGVKLLRIIQKLNQDHVEIQDPRPGETHYLFDSQPTLVFQGKSDGKLTIRYASRPDETVFSQDFADKEFSAALTEKLVPGRNALRIDVERFGKVVHSQGLQVVVAGSANELPLPDVQQYSVGTYGPLRFSDSSKPILVFSASPFLRLAGGSFIPDGTIRGFQLIGNQLTPAKVLNRPAVDSSSGRWMVEMELIGPPQDSGSFLMMQESKTGLSAPVVLPYKVVVPTTGLAPPVIRSIVLGSETGAADVEVKPDSDGVRYIKSTKIKLTTTLASPVGPLAAELDYVVHAFLDDNPKPFASEYRSRLSSPWELKGLPEGSHRVHLGMQFGNEPVVRGPVYELVIRSTGPRVVAVEPQNFGTAPGVTALRITFNPENPVAALTSSQLQLLPGMGTGNFDRPPSQKKGPVNEPTREPNSNTWVVQFTDVLVDTYQLTILPGVVDIFGNALEGTPGKPATPFVKVLGKTPTVEASYEARGIVATTGEFVPYQEFTKPREQRDGFNPSDKVETRVARLYYFRDAHRVAQIVNRKVKSYNRQGVDTARQLADRARNVAEQKATIRQQAERAAIEKAQKTRAKENEMRRLENAQNSVLNEIARAQTEPLPEAADQAAADKAEQDRAKLVRDLEAAARSFASQIDGLRDQIQSLRDDENAANEATQRAEAEERQSREEQFRREVAAARADPDTYAAGNPDSDDPVEQVSVSVIGEGLIQLRGPIKGINVIRTMIDQIDSPVGQVRVAVHTVQLNGEHASRMEEVSTASQRFIDQSRFLTLQSGELLRRSVVQVASQRADEARGLYPGETQLERDQRYLYSFFGRDFVEELKAMDSEFLRTGNKLLSLHSMDTTSLSSALTLMALARNDTRMEILQQFEEFCQAQLPQSEQNWFEQQFHCGLKKHHLGKLCAPPDFVPLAGNARFESLRGFFAADVGHQDTMTPLQREFLRLAQILKSRLIVEMELKQRVTERAIIEERGGNRAAELQESLAKEKMANEALASFEQTRRNQQTTVLAIASNLETVAKNVQQETVVLRGEVGDYWKQFLAVVIDEVVKQYPNLNSEKGRRNLEEALRDSIRKVHKSPREAQASFIAAVSRVIDSSTGKSATKGPNDAGAPIATKPTPWRAPIYMKDKQGAMSATRLQFSTDNGTVDAGAVLKVSDKPVTEAEDDGTSSPTDMSKDELFRQQRALIGLHIELAKSLARFNYDGDNSSRNLVAELEKLASLEMTDSTFIGIRLMDYEILQHLLPKSEHVAIRSAEITRRMQRVVAEISDADGDLKQVYQDATSLIADARKYIRVETDFGRTVHKRIDEFEQSLESLLKAEVAYDFARRTADQSRRPLDHKKFLDMLIDETEDKYIELLEGTRAHTANIDNYIKRLTTALDDDFNAQFYNPAFRLVRESSAKRYYNVQFGQIETTSILANNRAFAKVSPAASMEFDLPHRDILISEAIDGAMAVYRDVGALANDPSFLAMAKLKAGQSAATPAPGSTGGFSVVRNVVPGLAGDTTEQVIAQNANGGQQFGSNLENLIPDPAIYKFETGTGYEIRPVIQPDGQAVVFGFQYLYTTQIREPVRADEKHLGRIKRHYIDTDVQLSNFELREVSRYLIALKASRTSKGVPLLEDIPIAGALFRPAPSDESSLQQNVVLAQATIFPTLFDLMGLRWAPVVADLDPLRMQSEEFVVRGRNKVLRDRVYDLTSEKVDDFLRFPQGDRRRDYYRSQIDLPRQHPNGYQGPGLNQQDSTLQEGYSPSRTYPEQPYAPPGSREGSPLLPGRTPPRGLQPGQPPLNEALPREPDPEPIRDSVDPTGQGASRRRAAGYNESAYGASASGVNRASYAAPAASQYAPPPQYAPQPQYAPPQYSPPPQYAAPQYAAPNYAAPASPPRSTWNR